MHIDENSNFATYTKKLNI